MLPPVQEGKAESAPAMLSNFKNFVEQVKKRVLISGHHMPYLPDKPTDFRFPAPVSQRNSSVPHTTAEKGYDITYFNRKQRVAVSEGSTPLAPGEMPHHIPRPIWFDEKGLASQLDKYKAIGIIPIGKFFDYRTRGYEPFGDAAPYAYSQLTLAPEAGQAFARQKMIQTLQSEAYTQQLKQWNDTNAAIPTAPSKGDARK